MLALIMNKAGMKRFDLNAVFSVDAIAIKIMKIVVNAYKINRNFFILAGSNFFYQFSSTGILIVCKVNYF